MKKLIQFSAAITGLSLALIGCGGGDSSAAAAPAPAPAMPAPISVIVTAPPDTPSTGNGSIGISQTGPLKYLVYDNTSPTTGAGTTAIGAVNTAANTISFPNVAPFATGTGLVIANLEGSSQRTFNGGDAGGASNAGNVFYFCSAGMSNNAPDEPAAKAGQKVAFSGNVVGLTDIAVLDGKTFNEANCTNAPSKFTFGDGNGNLSMTATQFSGAAGPALTAAQVISAFSASGYTVTSGTGTGVNIKFRAYSNTEKGLTKYLVALLIAEPGGATHTSLLYLP